MKRNQRLMQVVLVIFELVLFILYARLRILNARLIRAPRMSFGDTTDYLFTLRLNRFSHRNFGWPTNHLLFPILQDPWRKSPHNLTVQLYFSIFCWGIFGNHAAHISSVLILKVFCVRGGVGFSLS